MVVKQLLQVVQEVREVKAVLFKVTFLILASGYMLREVSAEPWGEPWEAVGAPEEPKIRRKRKVCKEVVTPAPLRGILKSSVKQTDLEHGVVRPLAPLEGGKAMRPAGSTR